ncbi:hypothetical protein J4E06_07050 [Muricauda sp. NFXS6]|uniref:hypothetical protein n=1 Tax=Allomuricauda sp. NFXS6 TaxID=2819094 RepID=UPI0032DE4321
MNYPIFRLPKNGNSGSLLALKEQAGIILSIFIVAFCFPWISNGQITEGTYNLIDAEADTVLVQITDGMEWNLADVDSLNVQAINSYTVDRVVFRVNLVGTEVHSQGEGMAPYAAFGDNSGDYNNWGPLQATYTFTVDHELNNVVQGTDSFSITFVNVPTGSGSSIWSESGTTASYAGNVAIGRNSVPSGYALAVDGHVRTREVRVDQDTWPDYVFNKDYRLLSLQEVQEYIGTHGHLPNIPSADVVTSQGVQLGTMNRLLLEKIEELTLYILEQQRQIDQLQSDVKRLK